jgi:hypothetical protein
MWFDVLTGLYRSTGTVRVRQKLDRGLRTDSRPARLGPTSPSRPQLGTFIVVDVCVPSGPSKSPFKHQTTSSGSGPVPVRALGNLYPTLDLMALVQWSGDIASLGHVNIPCSHFTQCLRIYQLYIKTTQP